MDGTGAFFDEFVSHLELDFQIVVVSYPLDQPLDYRGLTEFARNYLPQTGPFILLGESFSGPIAMALAAQRPAGLIGLVLCCTFARNPRPFLGKFKNLLPVLPSFNRFSGFSAALLLGKFATPPLRLKLRETLKLVSEDALKMRMRSVTEIDRSSDMKKIDVPVLLLEATEDRVVPVSASIYLAGLLPFAQIVKIPGPHMLLQTRSSEAAILIKEFVERLQGRAH
jgi:pimeloyl-[acyl-carrier protein] methyl ester esterase